MFTWRPWRMGGRPSQGVGLESCVPSAWRRAQYGIPLHLVQQPEYISPLSLTSLMVQVYKCGSSFFSWSLCNSWTYVPMNQIMHWLFEPDWYEQSCIIDSNSNPVQFEIATIKLRWNYALQFVTAQTVDKTQTFAIYTIIRDGSQRGNMCKRAHSCLLQSVHDVRHYHKQC